MQIYRFYCQSISKGQADLSGSEVHHLINVMRLNSGDKIELFDGKGTIGIAVIEKIKSGLVTFTVKDYQKYPKPNSPQIVIASSIAKGDRFEWMIAKCTELGVDKIVPVIFERTVKQPKNPKITNRWNSVAISSAKQCKRLFLPQINQPLLLEDALETIKNDYPKSILLSGSLDDNIKFVIDVEIDTDVIAFVGPEGGTTDEEGELLQNYGAKPVRLTDNILRTETAAITFAAILSAKRNH